MPAVLEEYANDPVGFVMMVLAGAGTPYAKQAEVLAAVAAHRRVTVVGCNGSGKDWAAARAVLWWIETRERSKAIVTGPTQRQVEDVVWREMRMAHAMASRQLSGRMHRSRYEVDDERFAIGFSTDHPYNLQGFHSPQLLVVVTEAHGLGQAHMEALKRLNPSRLLLTGNPLTVEGEFYDSHHVKSFLYARIAISAFDTPNLTGDGGAVPGMLTPEDVEERRREWGEEHPLYTAAVLGRFPDALEDSLVSRRLIDEAVARWERGSAAEAEGAPWRIGVDVARFGQDKTVLCLRRGMRVERMETLVRADTMQVAGEAARMAQAYRATAVFVDESGVGGGVVDRLRELESPVIGVQVGGKPSQPARFADLRAELFWELRGLLDGGRLALPPDPELTSQLLALRYTVSSSGRVALQSKAELRRRGMPSPDKADALALAMMAPPSLEVWV